MKDKQVSDLNRDLELTLRKYPELTVVYKNSFPSELIGVFRITDDAGIEQGYWNVKILIPQNYPFAFPKLFETSGTIEHSPDLHINPDGSACVELDIIKNNIIKNKGIKILEFVDNYVYKFFCWILLYKAGYGAELSYWDHGKEGIKQFFVEVFNTDNRLFILNSLQLIKKNKLPDRNDLCYCGSGIKYKKCHEVSIKKVKAYDINQILTYSLLI